MKVKLKTKILREASRRNISSTLATAIVRKIVETLNQYVGAIEGASPIPIDIRPEIDRLKNISKKFDISLEQIILQPVKQIGGAAGSASGDGKLIKIQVVLPYSDIDLVTYTYRNESSPEDKFNQEIEKKLSYAYRSTAREKTREQYDEELLKIVGKPEHTGNTRADSFNINKFLSNLKKKKLVEPYYTKEDVKNMIRRVSPGGPKKAMLYDLLNESAKREGYYKIKDFFLVLMHELKHIRQDPDETERSYQDKSLLYLPDMYYLGYELGTARILPPGIDPVSDFFYFSRPIEVDARIAEYRKVFHSLKKENKDMAGENIFNIIMTREMDFLEGVKVLPNAIGKEIINLKNQEFKIKVMNRLLHQLFVTEKPIFNSYPYFKAALDQTNKKVDEINKDLLEYIQQNNVDKKYPKFNRFHRMSLVMY